MDLVTARLLARKGVLVPADFTSLLAWRLEKGGGHSADEDLGTKVEIVVDGTESMTFSSANNAVYFMRSDIAGNSKEYFINPECTHFTYGDGNVLAQMSDGEFIFNMSSATGDVTSGNISFKNVSVFTSLANAVAWFKEQAANGTPVTITYYVKQ